MKKSVFYLLMVFPWILQEQVPNLVSFTPQYGSVGSSLTLTGSNFDVVPANNIVFFGGVQAMVLSASATELIVEVPKGASYDFITVTVRGLIAQSDQPFFVTFGSNRTIGRSPDTFTDEETYAAGIEPYGLDAGDLDGDGLVDLVIGNYAGENFSIFRNTGDIDFEDKSDFALGAQANDVKLADFDGDGKLDLVITTEDASGTTYLEFQHNTTVSGSINFNTGISLTLDG